MSFLMWFRLALLAAVASALVMESLSAVPKDWSELRPALPDEPIRLRIALKQQLDRAVMLDRAALDIATPGHPNYGKHFTRDQLRSLTAPSDASISAVTAWLQKHAIQPVLDHDWFTFTTNVSTANRLLDSRFAWYAHNQAPSRPALRVLSYSVPDDIASHIDLIQPTTRFGNLAARKSTIFDVHRLHTGKDIVPGKGRVVLSGVDTDDSKDCVGFVTPECLRRLYNVRYKPVNPQGNKVAIVSFLEEYARYDDMEEFAAELLPEATNANFSVELVNGGLNDQASTSDSSELTGRSSCGL